MLAWFCVALTFAAISTYTNQPSEGAFATGISVAGWVFIYHGFKFFVERRKEVLVNAE